MSIEPLATETPEHARTNGVMPPPSVTQPETGCRFDLVGEADAGLLSRILEPIARLNIVPARCVADSQAGVMTISLSCEGLSPGQARTALARMNNIVGIKTARLVLPLSVGVVDGSANGHAVNES